MGNRIISIGLYSIISILCLVSCQSNDSIIKKSEVAKIVESIEEVNDETKTMEGQIADDVDFSVEESNIENVETISEINEENYEDEPEYDDIIDDKETLSYYTIPLGTYQDSISERASLQVTFKDGKYEFEINWANSAFENTKWTFSGAFDKDDNKVNYVNEKKYAETYSGGKKTTKQEFANGHGFVKYENEKIYWVDGQEERIYDDDYNGIFEYIEK